MAGPDDDLNLARTRQIAMAATPVDVPHVDWMTLLKDLATTDEVAANLAEPTIKPIIVDSLKAYNEPGLQWDNTTADPDFAITTINDRPVMQIKGLTLDADLSLLTPARRAQIGEIPLAMIGNFKGKIEINTLNLANPKGKTGIDGAQLEVVEVKDGDVFLISTSGQRLALPAMVTSVLTKAVDTKKIIVDGIQKQFDTALPVINGMRAMAMPVLPPLPGRKFEKVGLKLHAVPGNSQVPSVDFLSVSKVI